MHHDVKQVPPPAPAAATPYLRHKLRQRLGAWRAAGASPQVLRWISEGARCEWLQGPPPAFDHGVSFTGARSLTTEQQAFFEKELLRNYETGAWEDAPPDERTHISRAHLVPKKTAPGEPPSGASSGTCGH